MLILFDMSTPLDGAEDDVAGGSVGDAVIVALLEDALAGEVFEVAVVRLAAVLGLALRTVDGCT